MTAAPLLVLGTNEDLIKNEPIQTFQTELKVEIGVEPPKGPPYNIAYRTESQFNARR